ncbi:MAG: hypothetical protein A2Z94_02635 [Gallionellales bacterium GWA2_55_18]|nr:MAG: hypothetical protein A2Z94_02635 [Gallionellales bacterium GWA2_55_18]
MRDKKFPKDAFPQLYQYRALEPRLIAKIERSFRRKDFIVTSNQYSFVEGHAENVFFPNEIDCVITSPPYMNALDYGRDNRLRLWFIDKAKAELIDGAPSQQRDGFQTLMISLAQQVEKCLVPNGFCIVIVGDKTSRGAKYPLSISVQDIFKTHAPELNLVQTVINNIPDIRRARRDCRGVRTENFLIFKKENA